MIPKVIHYCWFGGNPLPDVAKKCIESWRKYLPDYKIVEWNESNFDINVCCYIKEAYEAKKWAFVTDYVRLYVLYNLGGIYMDTDVEVISSLDSFLDNRAFMGFEDEENVATSIMASEKGFTLYRDILSLYEDKSFCLSNGKYDLTTNVEIITQYLKSIGMNSGNKIQKIGEMKLYPAEYFCPKNYKTGQLKITDKTVTIHHLLGSWQSKWERYSLVIKRRTENKSNGLCLMGKILAGPFTYASRIETFGLKRATDITLGYIKDIIRTGKVK